MNHDFCTHKIYIFINLDRISHVHFALHLPEFDAYTMLTYDLYHRLVTSKTLILHRYLFIEELQSAADRFWRCTRLVTTNMYTIHWCLYNKELLGAARKLHVIFVHNFTHLIANVMFYISAHTHTKII